MTKINVPFNARLAAAFRPVAANDNGDPRPAISPLTVEDVTHDVARVTVKILNEQRLPRRAVADRVVNALYMGPYDIRYDDGEYFLAGYEIDADLSSDWTFSYIRDMYTAANDNGPMPSLTPLTVRRLNLLILWFFIDDIDRGQRLGVKPRFLCFDKDGRCIAA